jgi:hypothetical protein
MELQHQVLFYYHLCLIALTNKQEIERLGGEQLGSRKRDDYADGTARIPVNSPTP